MTDKQRYQLKKALLRCAEENEHRTYTKGHIVVSNICRSAEKRITELEQLVEKMMCCEKCCHNNEQSNVVCKVVCRLRIQT